MEKGQHEKSKSQSVWVLCTGQCDITESLGCCFTTTRLMADGEQSNFTLLFSQTPPVCPLGLFWSCTGRARSAGHSTGLLNKCSLTEGWPERQNVIWLVWLPELYWGQGGQSPGIQQERKNERKWDYLTWPQEAVNSASCVTQSLQIQLEWHTASLLTLLLLPLPSLLFLFSF